MGYSLCELCVREQERNQVTSNSTSNIFALLCWRDGIRVDQRWHRLTKWIFVLANFISRSRWRTSSASVDIYSKRIRLREKILSWDKTVRSGRMFESTVPSTAPSSALYAMPFLLCPAKSTCSELDFPLAIVPTEGTSSTQSINRKYLHVFSFPVILCKNVATGAKEKG